MTSNNSIDRLQLFFHITLWMLFLFAFAIFCVAAGVIFKHGTGLDLRVPFISLSINNTLFSLLLKMERMKFQTIRGRLLDKILIRWRWTWRQNQVGTLLFSGNICTQLRSVSMSCQNQASQSLVWLLTHIFVTVVCYFFNPLPLTSL